MAANEKMLALGSAKASYANSDASFPLKQASDFSCVAKVHILLFVF